jgi:hypothetical protein
LLPLDDTIETSVDADVLRENPQAAVTSDASFVSVMQFSMNSRGRTARGETFAAQNFVELIGIEPTTSGLQSQRSPN